MWDWYAIIDSIDISRMSKTTSNKWIWDSWTWWILLLTKKIDNQLSHNMQPITNEPTKQAQRGRDSHPKIEGLGTGAKIASSVARATKQQMSAKIPVSAIKIIWSVKEARKRKRIRRTTKIKLPRTWHLLGSLRLQPTQAMVAIVLLVVDCLPKVGLCRRRRISRANGVVVVVPNFHAFLSPTWILTWWWVSFSPRRQRSDEIEAHKRLWIYLDCRLILISCVLCGMADGDESGLVGR